ncbi:MAG: slipin family protein, partial [Cellvibrionaceae bacterium]|nr:slipin family protein [Cellvibrionaceae bacterium]
MIIWKTIDIADNERALLYRRNRFVGVLEPGRHRIFTWVGQLRLEKYDITDLKFDHPKAKFLLANQPEALEKYIQSYEM